MHKPNIKTIAAINDLSGSSRCSLTAAIPIISSMGMQCCPVPTAILSNHTGYNHYFFDDYTDKMEPYIAQWKKLNLKFDCIYSGFLGSEHQIEIVSNFIRDFKDEKTKIVIDPVMGDNGDIYSTYNTKMCSLMKNLAKEADVITPNVTEACILSDEDYTGEEISLEKAREISKKISKMGARSIIITGIKSQNLMVNTVFDSKSGEFLSFNSKTYPTYYSGTGDVFASLISGYTTLGKTVFEATSLATDFVARAVEYSYNMKTADFDGILFEKFLKEII